VRQGDSGEVKFTIKLWGSMAENYRRYQASLDKDVE